MPLMRMKVQALFLVIMRSSKDKKAKKRKREPRDPRNKILLSDFLGSDMNDQVE